MPDKVLCPFCGVWMDPIREERCIAPPWYLIDYYFTDCADDEHCEDCAYLQEGIFCSACQNLLTPAPPFKDEFREEALKFCDYRDSCLLRPDDCACSYYKIQKEHSGVIPGKLDNVTYTIKEPE